MNLYALVYNFRNGGHDVIGLFIDHNVAKRVLFSTRQIRCSGDSVNLIKLIPASPSFKLEPNQSIKLHVISSQYPDNQASIYQVYAQLDQAEKEMTQLQENSDRWSPNYELKSIDIDMETENKLQSKGKKLKTELRFFQQSLSSAQKDKNMAKVDFFLKKIISHEYAIKKFKNDYSIIHLVKKEY